MRSGVIARLTVIGTMFSALTVNLRLRELMLPTLVYPLLIVIGLKLLFADFPQGRPQTLFVALALYGFTLIAGPRLMRRPDAPSASPADGKIADGKWQVAGRS